jgi:hypothetical protein
MPFAMTPPACPRCREISPVALLSTVELRGEAAQTWVCRDCLSMFGNVDEWRRRVARKRLAVVIPASIALALGFAVILRRVAATA